MKKHISIILTVPAVCLLALIINSCAKEKMSEKLVPEDTSDIIISAEGAECTISYTIENFCSAGTVTASSDVDWIPSLYCGEYGTVSFIVDRNQDRVEREALVTVSYDVMAQSFQVRVVQEGASVSPKLVLVSSDTVRVSVPGGKYEIEYDLFGGISREELSVNYDAEWISSFSIEDKVISLFIGPNISETPRSAEVMIKYPGLEELSVEVVQESLSAEELDLSIDSVGTHMVQVTVVPTSARMEYVVMTDTKDHIDAVGGDYELFQDDLAFFQQYAALYGISIAEVMEMFMKHGEQTVIFNDLEDDTDYYCYGYGINEDAEYQTLIYRKEFRTDAIEYTDCIFNVSVDPGPDYAAVDVEPTDNDVMYIVGIMDPDMFFMAYGEFGNASMQALVNDIVSAMSKDGLTTQEIIGKMTYTGKQSLLFDGLEPDTDNMVYCVGLNSEADIVTDAFSLVFRTSEDPDVPPLSFEFNVSGLEPRSVTASVTPSENDSYYCWGIVNSTFSQEDVVAVMEEDSQIYIDLGVVDDFEGYVEAYLKTSGARNRTFENLVPSTGYKLYAIQVSKSGEFSRPMVFSEEFATPEASTASCSISIQYDKFWDGEELAQLYPDFAQFSQYAVLPVTVMTNGDAASFKYAFLSGDWADSSLHSDDEVIQYLYNYGFSFSSNIFFVTWDYAFAIVAVAVDSSGNYSEVFRATDIFSKADAADPSEYKF